MAYRLEILGPPRIIPDQDTPDASLSLGKPLALLSFLVVEARPVSREELGRLLWPGSPPSRARHSVRQAVWLVRKTLGEAVVEGDDPITVSPKALSTDLRDFEAALTRGDVDRARSLWRGPLLDRLTLSDCREWEHWLEENREILRGRFFRSLLEAARLLMAEGREGQEQAWVYLEEATGQNPHSLEARLLYLEALLELGSGAALHLALEEARREVGELEGAPEALAEVEERVQALQSREAVREPERLGESMEMVGRSGEVADLKGLWRRLAVGRPQMASIVGPAGIGKSRLAEEFLRWVRMDGGRVARAKGYRGEDAIERGVLVDLVRELLSLPGAGGVSSASDALLRSIVPSLSSGESGPPASVETPAAALTDAVTDLLGAVGFEGPVAVFVDDVQWADPESRALLFSVMRRVRNVPVLFLLGERTGGRGEWGGRIPVEEMGGRILCLEPLGEKEVGELLTLLAEVQPPEQMSEVVRKVHRASEGNPLFIAELLRALVEAGACRYEEDGWILKAGKMPSELELPESLRALVGDRLARLSREAGVVAGALAAAHREVAASYLFRESGLAEEEFTRAMRELLDREVVVWMGEHRLGFAHDQLRGAAARRFRYEGRKEGPLGRFAGGLRETPGRLAAAAVIVLLVLVGWGGLELVGPSGDPPPATYPFGRGRVLFLGEPPLEFIPPARAGEAWEVREAVLTLPESSLGDMRGPFRTWRGGVRWFGNTRHGEDPPVALELFRKGSPEVVMEAEGDVGFHSLSPAGTEALLMRERRPSPTYAQDLLVLDLETGEERVLYEAQEMMGGTSWSRDGQRIAVVVRGLPDTLLVLTPTGEKVGSFPLQADRTLNHPRWCQDNEHLVLRATGAPSGGAFLMDLRTGGSTQLASQFSVVSRPLCLRKAKGIVYSTWERERGGMVVLEDPTTGEVRVLRDSVSVPDSRALRWVPDTVAPPIREIRVTGAEPTLPWGERRSFGVQGIRVDGSREPVEAHWMSRDPAVASVSQEGLVTANGVGTALLVAEHRGWIRDSLRVRVTQAGSRPDVLFRETFDDGDLSEDWVMRSTPPFRVEENGERRVLFLCGDARFPDFMRTRTSFPLDQGVTLELGFRLPLTDRRDRQRLEVCLQEDAGSLEDLSAPSRPSLTLCFRFPTDELAKFQPDQASVTLLNMGVREEFHVGPWLPSSDWTHLALQLRADGALSVFLNRELTHRSDVVLPLEPRARVHVRLGGASVDTRLLIRDVVLWRGERFGEDVAGDDPGPPA